MTSNKLAYSSPIFFYFPDWTQFKTLVVTIKVILTEQFVAAGSNQTLPV